MELLLSDVSNMLLDESLIKVLSGVAVAVSLCVLGIMLWNAQDKYYRMGFFDAVMRQKPDRPTAPVQKVELDYEEDDDEILLKPRIKVSETIKPVAKPNRITISEVMTSKFNRQG
jgi:hypothetical protein